MAWFNQDVDDTLKKIADDKAQQKLEREARKDKETAIRFRLDNKPDSYYPMTAEVIILDANLDTPRFHEYALENIFRKPNSNEPYIIHEISCENMQGSEDPLAGQQIGKNKAKSYFVQMFTVLNCTPAVDKEKDASGKMVVKKDVSGKPVLKKNEDGSLVYYKSLLPIKSSQMPEFLEKFKKWYEKHGTLRGIKLRLTRSGDDKSPVIGKIDALDLDNNKAYDFLTEQELIEKYGHPEVKDKDNNVVLEANKRLKPFQYITEPNGHKADIFKLPDANEQRKRWGLGAVAGSSSANSWIKEEQQKVQEQQPAPQQAQPEIQNFDAFKAEHLLDESDIPF